MPTTHYGPQQDVRASAPVAVGQFITSGTGNPAVPVTGKQVRPAGAGDAVAGVSTCDRAADDHRPVTYAACGERPIRLKISPAQVGAIRRGQYLKAAADGFAVAADFAADHIGARALTSNGQPGEFIDAEVCLIDPTDP